MQLINRMTRFGIAGLLAMAGFVCGLQAQTFNACVPGAGVTDVNLSQGFWSNRTTPTTFPVSASSGNRDGLPAGMRILASDGAGNFLMTDGTAVYVVDGRPNLTSKTVSLSEKSLTPSAGATAGVWDGTGFLWATGSTLRFALVTQQGIGVATSFYNLSGTVNDMAYDGSNLWVATSKGLYKVSYQYTSNASRSTLPIPAAQGAPVLVSPSAFQKILHDGLNLWCAGAGALAKIDPTTYRLTTGASVTPDSRLLFDGAFVWVLQPGGITRVDPTTAQTVAFVNTPNGGSLTGAFDGRYFWVTDLSTGAVLQVRACDGTIAGSFSAPGASYTFYLQGHVYVYSASSMTVTGF